VHEQQQRSALIAISESVRIMNQKITVTINTDTRYGYVELNGKMYEMKLTEVNE